MVKIEVDILDDEFKFLNQFGILLEKDVSALISHSIHQDIIRLKEEIKSLI